MKVVVDDRPLPWMGLFLILGVQVVLGVLFAGRILLGLSSVSLLNIVECLDAPKQLRSRET